MEGKGYRKVILLVEELLRRQVLAPVEELLRRREALPEAEIINQRQRRAGEEAPRDQGVIAQHFVGEVRVVAGDLNTEEGLELRVLDQMILKNGAKNLPSS